MNRLLLVVLLCLTLLTFGLGLPGVGAEGCQFVLGFKTLHDLIPDVVGQCKSDVSYNAVNGDGLQYTTGGMLVWRKADNWTAFTDGYRTWINGPLGLQQRLNTERFPWEPDYAGTPPVNSGTAPAPTSGNLIISRPGEGAPVCAGRVMTFAVTLGTDGWVQIYNVCY